MLILICLQKRGGIITPPRPQNGWIAQRNLENKARSLESTQNTNLEFNDSYSQKHTSFLLPPPRVDILDTHMSYLYTSEARRALTPIFWGSIASSLKKRDF